MTENNIRTSCANCGQEITENFCSNCGQKKYKRIDRKYLVDELQYTVLHTNKGFFYTIKNLIKNPGKTAREFVDGNRVNHYKPILLAFVLAGITTFLAFKVIGMNVAIDFFEVKYKNDNFMSEFWTKYMYYMSKYFTVITMLGIPFVALGSYFSFKKWKHNYYEHFILMAFAYSTNAIFTVLFLYPIYYLAKDNYLAFMIISQIGSLFSIGVLFWFYKGFYAEKSVGDVIVRLILMMGLLFVFLIIVSIGLGIAYGAYLVKTGQFTQ